jgi:hypothetical protein
MKKAVLALLLAVPLAHAQSLRERGDYLVNGIMTCQHCHTPKDAKGNPVMERQFTGGVQRFNEPQFSATGSNITQDRQTGIGAWSEADIRRALIEGLRPNGVRLAMVMPYGLYSVLTPRDLDAVVAYLRGVEPMPSKVAPPQYKAEQLVIRYPGAEKPMTDDDLRVPAKRGLYLATLAHCMACHAERKDDLPNFRTGAGKGGRDFPLPKGGTVKAANITSHPKAGLGAWTDAEIRRALTDGVSRDGRPLAPIMAGYSYYLRRLTDEDMSALIGWVRSLPPLE